MKWTTKDGREIEYKDLGDEHLLNILTYLQRRCGYLKSREETRYLTMPEPNGDWAHEAWEQEQLELSNMCAREWMKNHHRHYQHLVKEAQSRNLDIPNNWATDKQIKQQALVQTAKEAVPILNIHLKQLQKEVKG